MLEKCKLAIILSRDPVYRFQRFWHRWIALIEAGVNQALRKPESTQIGMMWVDYFLDLVDLSDMKIIFNR